MTSFRFKHWQNGLGFHFSLPIRSVYGRLTYMGLILVVNSCKYTVHECYGLQKHTATFDAKATKFQLRAPNNANVVWDIVLGTFMFSQKGTRSHILLFQKLTNMEKEKIIHFWKGFSVFWKSSILKGKIICTKKTSILGRLPVTIGRVLIEGWTFLPNKKELFSRIWSMQFIATKSLVGHLELWQY